MGNGSKFSTSAETVARSLRQTVDKAEMIEQAASRLAAGGNDHAAGADQTRTSLESILTSIEQTAAAAEQLTRSQSSVATSAKEPLTGFESNASAPQEVPGKWTRACGRRGERGSDIADPPYTIARCQPG